MKPKPDSHEAEALTKLEAEALTLINLEAEAEALVTKPKPSYLYYTPLQKKCTMRECMQSRSFGKRRSRSL